jgi:hypothetical protein
VPGLFRTGAVPVAMFLAPRGEGLHVLPRLSQALNSKRRNRQCLGKAVRVLRTSAQKLQRPRVIRDSAHRGGFQVAVGLVHQDQVGHLHDPAFHPLQLVAPRRGKEEDEEVAQFRDDGFALPDAHRLDQDQIEARGLAQRHRFAGAAGDAAKLGLAGRGANEGAGVTRQTLHPGLVAQDRPAGAGGGGVDGKDGDLQPLPRQHQAEGLDEGGFADAGGAG